MFERYSNSFKVIVHKDKKHKSEDSMVKGNTR